MRLTRVVVDNWRGFQEAAVDFSPGGYTALTGPNNAGKSLLLQAAEAAVKGEGVADGRSVASVWEIEPDETVERGTRPGQHRYLDPYVQGIVRETAKGDGRDLVLLSRNALQSPSQKTLASFEHFHPQFIAVPLRDRRGGGEGLVVQSHRSSGQTVADSVSTELIEEMRTRSRPVTYRLPTIRGGGQPTVDANATPELLPDGSNLANVLLWLQTREQAGWQTVRQFFGSVFPGSGLLLAQATGQSVEIVLRDDTSGIERNLKELGTGLEQLLMVCVACETQVPGSLVLIDEPEIGLHPGAQRILAQRFHEWSRDRSVLVATHSPVLVSESRGVGQVHLVTRDAAGATVHLVTDDQRLAFNELGVSTVDVLGVDRFIVTEGISDTQLVKALFAELLLGGRIGVVEANGGSKVRSVVEAVARLSAAFEGRVLGIVDRDEAPSQVHGVHVLPCREIENVFLRLPAVVADLLESRGCPVDTNLVAETIEAEAVAARDNAIWLRAVQYLQGSIRSDWLTFRRKGEEVDKSAAGLIQLRDMGMSTLPNDGAIKEAWQEAAGSLEVEWDMHRLDIVPGADVLAAVLRRLSDGSVTYRKARDLGLLAELALGHRDAWPAALTELEAAISRFAITVDRLDSES